jgi:D-amino peptidase
MKIYVICDLEGTAGVVDHSKQCRFDGEYFWQARQNATLELNALVEGALDCGVDEIVAWDGHGSFPGGLDVDILHPACKLVMGAGDDGPLGLDEHFDAVLQCGLHAMAGTKQAVLAHSFMGHIAGIWVNDVLWGEIAMNAHTAGVKGVPCVFLSGDQAAADEARALIANIEVAVVKQGLSPDPIELSRPSPALSLAPEKARDVIRQAVQRALERRGEIRPFRFDPPYTIRTRFYQEAHAERAADLAGVRRLDMFTVVQADLQEIELIF